MYRHFFVASLHTQESHVKKLYLFNQPQVYYFETDTFLGILCHLKIAAFYVFFTTIPAEIRPCTFVMYPPLGFQQLMKSWVHTNKHSPQCAACKWHVRTIRSSLDLLCSLNVLRSIHCWIQPPGTLFQSEQVCGIFFRVPRTHNVNYPVISVVFQ